MGINRLNDMPQVRKRKNIRKPRGGEDIINMMYCFILEDDQFLFRPEKIV